MDALVLDNTVTRLSKVGVKNRNIPEAIGEYMPVYDHGEWFPFDPESWETNLGEAMYLPHTEDPQVLEKDEACPR